MHSLDTLQLHFQRIVQRPLAKMMRLIVISEKRDKPFCAQCIILKRYGVFETKGEWYNREWDDIDVVFASL